MRMPSSSSMFLATLASSASLSSMVSAAPTEAKDAGAVAPASGGDASAAGVPDIAGILGSLPSARRGFEARQLGGVMDTVADMLPIDPILGMLGLTRQSVTPEALSSLEAFVKQVPSGLPLPLPLPLSGGTPAPSGTPAPAAPAAQKAARSNRPGFSESHGESNASFALPLNLAAALPAAPGPLAGVVPSPPVALPSLPVPAPGSSNSTAPSPAPPAGAPAAPLSPSLPVPPPNTPAVPPLFSGASFNETEGYPQNNCTGPATTPSAMAMESNSATTNYPCPTSYSSSAQPAPTA